MVEANDVGKTGVIKAAGASIRGEVLSVAYDGSFEFETAAGGLTLLSEEWSFEADVPVLANGWYETSFAPVSEGFHPYYVHEGTVYMVYFDPDGSVRASQQPSFLTAMRPLKIND